MNNPKEKARSPFTPTYEVGLSLHESLPKEDHPEYVFRAATIAERHREQEAIQVIDDAPTANPEDVSIDSIIATVLPLLQARLVRVTVGGKDCPEEMDLENRLDVSSVIELFIGSHNMEIPMLSEKKRLLLPSISDTEESVPDAPDATEPRTQETESRNSVVQTATATVAEVATDLDGLN